MIQAADHPSFLTDYAAFLCAAHASFTQAHTPLPRRWPWSGWRNTSSKPWKAVLDAALAQSATPDGIILEFGVFQGNSLRYLAQQRPQAQIHGFDSFQGFPRDGRTDWTQDFAVAALPEVPGNVTLHPGFFAETVPPFAAQWQGQRPQIALIHVDCDIFSAAHTVLQALGPYLRAGDVIVFDELMNYTEFAANEFLALYLMLRETGLDFEWAVAHGAAFPVAQRAGQMLDTGFAGYRTAGYFQNQAIRLCDRTQDGHFGGPAAPAALVDHLAAQIPQTAPAG